MLEKHLYSAEYCIIIFNSDPTLYVRMVSDILQDFEKFCIVTQNFAKRNALFQETKFCYIPRTLVYVLLTTWISTKLTFEYSLHI
jgi:hypothetical protein